MRAVVIAAFSALALTTCNQADRTEMKEDAKAVAADVKDSAREIGASEAMTDLKEGAKDAASDTRAVIKKGASELKEGVADAGQASAVLIAEARSIVALNRNIRIIRWTGSAAAP